MEDKLNSKAYQTVSQRMQTEEATCALTMNSHSDDVEYVYLINIYNILFWTKLTIMFSFYFQKVHSMVTMMLAVSVAQHL